MMKILRTPDSRIVFVIFVFFIKNYCRKVNKVLREDYEIVTFVEKETMLNRLVSKSCRASQFLRRINSKSSKTLQVINRNKEVSTISSPWVEVPDPKGSNLRYWWNKETNETSALGEIKPEFWIEQQDPAGSNLTYWWNPETNETTALGAADPSRKRSALSNGSSFLRDSQPASFGGMIVHSMVLGFGFSFAIIMVRMMIG